MSKKTNLIEDDDPLEHEIDFTKMTRVSNTFARDFYKAKNLRILDPELLEIFPDSESMNEVLRMIVRAAKAAQPKPQKLSARRATSPKPKKRKVS